MATTNSTRSRETADSHFAEKTLTKIMRMPAPLDAGEDIIIEKRLQQEGVTRRCALAVLTQPGKFTMRQAMRDRDFAESLAAIYVRLRDVTEFHESLTKTLGQAEAILMFGLAQRADMQELLDTAKAELTRVTQ